MAAIMGWMLAAVDAITPFVWAGAAVLVGGIAWSLRRLGGAAVDDRIDPKLKPFYDRLDEHLKTEEADRSATRKDQAETRLDVRSIRDELRLMRDNQTQDNRRIWGAIEELRKR